MEKFSYETNGYNRSEVNQFVSDVISETEGVITRVKSQRDEIEKLKKLPLTNKDAKAFVRFFFADACEVETDKLKKMINSIKPKGIRRHRKGYSKHRDFKYNRDLE